MRIAPPGSLQVPGSLLAAGIVLLLTACGDDPQADPKSDPKAATQTAPEPPKTERERLINNTQALDVVGYDGQAVKRNLQKTVNIYDKHNDDVQKAAEAAGLADPAEPAASK